MKNKRFRKLDTLRELRGHEFVEEFGDEGDVEIGVIAFGSTVGVIREATDRARAEGFKVAHLHVRLINPLPVIQINSFASRCRKILVPELNYTGQFAGWLKINTDLKFSTYHKDEGVPFTPNEIYQQITKLSSD